MIENFNQPTLTHPPRILIVYGSLRGGSYSYALAEEVEATLAHLGAESVIYNPKGLPVFDLEDEYYNPKVQELFELAKWSEGQFWISPEYHGNITGLFKNQIDWMPCSGGAKETTEGKALAVAQIAGGRQSFNTVNSMRQIGRWIRMLVTPGHFSLPTPHLYFDDDSYLVEGEYKERLYDLCEELVKYTYLTRENPEYFTKRITERQP